MGKIQVLPPEEARKIAAGEVVERPASLVREFLDNAIDSGAKNIELCIEAGGIKLTEVSDDGCGMSRADLELSIKTHATSKIRSMAELATARTLGFRGEALAAAAAVAELEILSCEGEEGASGEAWLLQAGPDAPDSEPHIEAARRTRGSSVRTRNLFDSIPARKRFLKREGSEALMCKQIFIDKALAFPEINFRFVQDGKLKLFFPAVKTHKERFASAVLAEKSGGASGFSAFLHEIAAHGRGYDLIIVVGGPEIYRDQRREQFIFANGRRINDFSLQQALEYGTQGAFPNGTHPVGAVFLEIDGALADFNIHPAKREARFICAADIHHTLTGTLRFYFHSLLEKYFKHEVHGEEKGFGVRGLGYRDLESKYSDISGIYPSDKNNISNTPPHTPYPIPLIHGNTPQIWKRSLKGGTTLPNCLLIQKKATRRKMLRHTAQHVMRGMPATSGAHSTFLYSWKRTAGSMR
jgi:DNA mismatch repair protein MutL